MSQFDCRFVTEEGNVIETVMEADSKYEIYETAESRNELVLSVKEHKEPFRLGNRVKRFRKVKPQELENLTSQLSIMLSSGVPLIGSLQALVEQAETDNMRKVLEEVIAKVNGGMAFSQALAEYPRVFNTMYVNMVKAGETAGVLDQLLTRLGTFIQHDIEVSRNIKAAMRYPLIVFSALVLAFTGAVVFIIPRFAALFRAQGVDLPLPTRIMIGLSEFMVGYWWMVIVGVVGLIAGLIFYVRTPAGAYQFDLLKLKTPIFKEIVLKATIARFAHMLETLTRGGIQIIRALETTEKTVGNLVISKVIREAKEKVEEGVSLADALSKSKYFPRMTVRMIAVGEQSGALERMLENVASQYDATVDVKIKRLSAAIEPMMTVAMGALLLLIALGIFLPMWNMYAAVK